MLGRNLGYDIPKRRQQSKINGYHCEPLPETLEWADHIQHMQFTLSKNDNDILMFCCKNNYSVHEIFFSGNTREVAKHTRKIIHEYLQTLVANRIRNHKEQYVSQQKYHMKRKELAHKEYMKKMKDLNRANQIVTGTYENELTLMENRYNNMEESNDHNRVF